jgi:hypothetical protein
MRADYDDCHVVGVGFVPLALPVETFGGWHPDAATQICRIARLRSMARQSGAPESGAIKHFF